MTKHSKKATTRKPIVEYVALGDMFIESKAQRQSLDTVRVNEIAENLDLGAIGLLIVNRRAVDQPNPGRYALLDGMHRREALLTAGFTRQDVVECEVFDGLTLTEEANMFLKRNDRKVVSAVDKFLARITQGDADIVAQAAILEDNGWSPKAGAGTGCFSAVDTLGRLYVRGKLLHLNPNPAAQVIGIVTKAWGHQAEGVFGGLISGLGKFLIAYGDSVDLSSLVDKLNRYPGGPGRLIGAARGYKAVVGGSTVDAVAQQVLDLYNTGRSTGKLRPLKQATGE